MKRLLPSLVLLLVACTAKPSTTMLHPEWTAELYPSMNLAIQHPVTWTIATENGKEVFHHPTDVDTTITLYKGNTLREEVEERKIGDVFLSAEDHRIDGGFVTIITYSNEGISRYRDYLFHRFPEGDEKVVVAQMIATVAYKDGLPDFAQTTEAEEILGTVRLLSPSTK